MEFTLNFALAMIFIFLAPALVGGWMARKREDFFTRGFVLSFLSSWYGPLFMYLAPNSKAKHGDPDDQESWPITGPLANMCAVATAILVFMIYKFV